MTLHKKGAFYLHSCKYLKMQFPEHLSRRTILVFRIEVTVQNKADSLLSHVLGSLEVLDDAKYRGADKSLARPGRKQATATKL